MLILPEAKPPPYRIKVRHGRGTAGHLYSRCANYATAAGCNRLVRIAENASEKQTLCRSCRLNRTIPDLAVDENAAWWARIEDGKRQVISTLIALGLPVRSRVTEDVERGLAFDLIRAPAGGPGVVTGHAQGIITIDIEEADDAIRETRRAEMREPYRTLLGHLRHEVGHYYWYRLLGDSPWQREFRVLFGDERVDYPAALRSHYDNGPPSDWALTHVSAYASAHSWEDWAESWAHYLHMIDSLDTALSFGVRAGNGDVVFDHFQADALSADGSTAPDVATFLAFVNAWIELTTAMNELARSMGQHDFYPFVLSTVAVRKLHFVHRVVTESHAGRQPLVHESGASGTSVANVAH